MYAVQVYKINYDRKATESRWGIWHKQYDYDYKIIGYELKEEYLDIVYKNDVGGPSLIKYEYDDFGNEIYSDYKENERHYYW